jgi:hypothetical protein
LTGIDTHKKAGGDLKYQKSCKHKNIPKMDSQLLKNPHEPQKNPHKTPKTTEELRKTGENGTF